MFEVSKDFELLRDYPTKFPIDKWKKLYEVYLVEIRIREGIRGGIPKKLDLIDPWLRRNGVPEPLAKNIAMSIEEENEHINAEADKSSTTFMWDAFGPYLETRCGKAHIREVMRAAGIFSGTGSVARLQNFQHGLYVKAILPEFDEVTKQELLSLYGKDYEGILEERLRFYKGGKTVAELDESAERVVHGMTMRGKRTSLRREDLTGPCRMAFLVLVGKPYADGARPAISKKMLEGVFERGQENGLGATRSQGAGKYTLLSLRKITPDASAETTAEATAQ